MKKAIAEVKGGTAAYVDLMYKQRFRPPNYKKTPKCNYAHIRYIATRLEHQRMRVCVTGLFGKLYPVTW
jgi:hypothetical protein